MANKKISELESRASLSLSDLMAVGDPSTGYLYKTTISDLKTLTGAGVVSFNGRFGTVNPAEGDYTLTQLGDVIITSPSNGQVLKYNGSNWVNATEVAEADTLDTVTGRGNTTANSITVGSVTAAGLSNLLGQIRTFATTGNTYIGASPVSASDAGYKLDVNGALRVGIDGVYGTNGTTTAPLVKFNTSNLVQLDPQGYGAITGATLSVGGQLSNNGYLTSTNYHMVKGGSTAVNTPFMAYGIGRPDADYSLQPLSGIGGYFAGAAWYNGAGLTFYTSAGTDITGGANLAEAMRLTPAGVLSVTNLSGTGSRMVVADANGVLSTQAIPTSAVTSVFGRTGAVVSASGDYTTSQVTEGTNLYYTDARARAAITLTTTGSSGAATYSGGTLNIPTYTLAGLGGQPALNGTGFVKISGTTISYDNSTYVTIDTAQTITGAKTFSNVTTFNQNIVGGLIKLSQGVLLSKSANVGSDPGFLSIIATSSTGLNTINIADGDNTSFTQKLIVPNGGNYNYTFPTSSGTLALASSLSSYLPLSGGTLTGALNGTSATFTFTGGVPALNVRASDANFALASIFGNQAGDVNWLLMSGFPVAGDFTIRQSDTVNALTIKKTTGAATFSSSVTSNGGNFTSYTNALNTYQLNLYNTFDSATQHTHMGAFVGNSYWSTNWYFAGGPAFDDNTKNSASIVLNGNGNIDFNNALPGNAPGNKMTILANGNVGINTTNPANILTVVGGAASPVALNLSTANSNCDIIMTSGAGGGLVRLRNNLDDFQIHTSGSERMRITSGGQLLVGATSTPGYIFSLQYNASAAAVMSIRNSSSTGYSGAHLLDNAGNLVAHFGYANSGIGGGLSDQVYFGSIASKSVVFTTNDSEKMRITSSGNIEIATGSIKTGSPTGGTAQAWKLGEDTNTLYTATRTIKVEIAGSVYYLLAVKESDL